MLIVLIHNDGTGTQHSANYDVEVRINEHQLWRGRVLGHDRDEGWPNLLQTIGVVGQVEGQGRQRKPKFTGG